MHIGVLGTGKVGRTLSDRLLTAHSVTMGSRSADNETARQWLDSLPMELRGKATVGTFSTAAQNSELVINATNGVSSLAALEQAGSDNLAGKVLLDVANPLDFSGGFPPRLSICNDDSLAEQIQRAFPNTAVVKALNTVNCQVMLDPARLAGEHVLFMAGNEAAAKAEVLHLLAEFGWPERRVLDLGDLSAARGMEMYLPLWVRMVGIVGSTDFNISIAT